MNRENCGFTDIHAHFLYGLDDGARDRRDMELMLDAAQAQGITTLYATPHVTPGIDPYDAEIFRMRLKEAQFYLSNRGFPIALHLGAEILYTPVLEQYTANHRLPTLGDSDDVLIEFVPDIAYRELVSAVDFLERSGYHPILAHIERYQCLYVGWQAARLKKNSGVRYQVNANTVLSNRGFIRAHIVQSWFRTGLVDYVATDAHNRTHRTFNLKKAYDALKGQYGSAYAAQLTGYGSARGK